jgi:hypothetical protein
LEDLIGTDEDFGLEVGRLGLYFFKPRNN